MNANRKSKIVAVVVFLAVIIALLSVIIRNKYVKNREIHQAQLLTRVISSVALVQKNWSISLNGTNYNFGDLNDDHILDVNPEYETDWSENLRNAAIQAGYKGFLQETGIAIPEKFIGKYSRIIDPWGNPMHIEWAGDRFGSCPFGIWSNGPDGIAGTKDDIASWRD